MPRSGAGLGVVKIVGILTAENGYYRYIGTEAEFLRSSLKNSDFPAIPSAGGTCVSLPMALWKCTADFAGRVSH
jgi:hypothetical protein